MVQPDDPDQADPKAGRDEASDGGETARESGRAEPASDRPAEPASPAPPASDRDASPEGPVPPETDQPLEPGSDQDAGSASPAPPATEKRAEEHAGESDDAPGEEDAAAKDKQQGRYVLQVRFGALPVTGTATATRADISKGAPCIVRTSRGMELGLALGDATEVEGQVGETVGHVLRPASARDLERQSKIEDELEPDEFRYGREKIRERGLRMRMSAVEHIWGGERVVFYFTAERRVDFRALVRDLAWHYHTRIEL
ncbi:MAG: regulatory iron-sulfur-containing complex subunit RicT, partial [Planctomycetota bacterium]